MIRAIGLQTVEETVHYGCQRVIDRHFVKQQGDRQSNHHRPRRRNIAFQLELNQGEEKQDRSDAIRLESQILPAGS